MPKFSTHVALMTPEYQPANFAPGDEVPEWALDQVDQHVLEPEATDASDGDADFTGTPAPPNEEGTPDDSDQENVPADSNQDKAPDDSQDGSGVAAEATDADEVPDFTAPAPARRGRPRKQ